MSDFTPIDPIEPTAIGPGLAAMSLASTVWDDMDDGQHAVSPDAVVWVRHKGIWHRAAWWQTIDAEEIVAICEDPDEWAYDLGWPRAWVEDHHGGALVPITLPRKGAGA